MKKTGVVKSADMTCAVVAITRDSACGENCAACGLCGGLSEMSVTVKNTCGLRAGDAVVLTSDDSAVLKRSVLGYATLTLLLILGGVTGNAAGGDLCAFFGAVFGVAVGVLLIKKAVRRCGDMEIKVERLDDK